MGGNCRYGHLNILDLLSTFWIFKFPPKMTAATAAAASQELSQSGKSLDPSRAGTKYPVQESLTSIYTCTSTLCKHACVDMVHIEVRDS